MHNRHLVHLPQVGLRRLHRPPDLHRRQPTEMTPAFISPLPTASRSSRLATATTPTKRTPNRPSVRMAIVSRPRVKNFFADDEIVCTLAEPVETPSAPEVTAIAATVCEFMNTEHVRDIASYVVRFGKKFVCIVSTPF